MNLHNEPSFLVSRNPIWKIKNEPSFLEKINEPPLMPWYETHQIAARIIFYKMKADSSMNRG